MRRGGGGKLGAKEDEYRGQSGGRGGKGKVLL